MLSIKKLTHFMLLFSFYKINKGMVRWLGCTISLLLLISTLSSLPVVGAEDDKLLDTKNSSYDGTVSPFQSSLQALTFNEPNHMEKTALVLYSKGAPSAESTTWDDTSQFMRDTDEKFFNDIPSKKSIVAGVIAGLVGFAIPCTPATGAVVWGIGDAIHIPKGGTISDIVVAEIMTTMSPLFARQFYLRGNHIIRALAGELPFPPGGEDNKPHFYESSLPHKALKFLVAAGTLIEGSFYWGLVYLAERNGQENTAYAMGWGTALVFAERYYTIGMRDLDRLFIKYFYDSGIIQQKRNALKGQALRALLEVERNDKFVDQVYDTIQQEVNPKNSSQDSINLEGDDTESQQKAHYFALSALLLRHIISPSIDEDAKRPSSQSSSDSTAQLGEEVEKKMAFQLLTDRMTPSAKEAFIDYLSVFITGLGSFSRLLGRQYIFELVLETLSADPSLATDLAWGFAAFDVVFRSILEYDVQKTYWQSWLKAFSLSHLVDFQIPRKCLGWLSLLNGGWFALANSFAAAENFDKIIPMPLPLKVLCVVPNFVLDLGYVSHYCEEQTNGLITSAAALNLNCDNCQPPSIRQKRAHCHLWIKRLLEFLKRADTETISVIFDKTQRAS